MKRLVAIAALLVGASSLSAQTQSDPAMRSAAVLLDYAAQIGGDIEVDNSISAHINERNVTFGRDTKFKCVFWARRNDGSAGPSGISVNFGNLTGAYQVSSDCAFGSCRPVVDFAGAGNSECLAFKGRSGLSCQNTFRAFAANNDDVKRILIDAKYLFENVCPVATIEPY